MYHLILILHSIFRWFILIFLIYSIYRGIKGWTSKGTFTKTDQTVRQITASLVHFQFLLGILLYFISPITSTLLSHFSIAITNPVISFFGMSHTATMFLAVVIITIGAALSKKAATDDKKFSRMTIFYTIGLILTLIMIPWPFSPFVQRPFL